MKGVGASYPTACDYRLKTSHYPTSLCGSGSASCFLSAIPSPNTHCIDPAPIRRYDPTPPVRRFRLLIYGNPLRTLLLGSIGSIRAASVHQRPFGRRCLRLDHSASDQVFQPLLQIYTAYKSLLYNLNVVQISTNLYLLLFRLWSD